MRQVKGFTLIELLIGLLTAAILSRLAWPSYINLMESGQRKTAQMQLLSLHLQQQNFLLNHGQFGSEADLALPKSDHYRFEVTLIDNKGFKVIANKKNNNYEKCPSFALDHELTREPDACW